MGISVGKGSCGPCPTLPGPADSTHDSGYTRVMVDPHAMSIFTIDDAILLAAAAHRGQRDKGRPYLPYLTHPMRVMTAFDDPVLQMIAILHDAVEDTALTLDLLREAGAPDRVVAGIEAITHGKSQPDEIYWAQVRGNPDAHAVKLADIADNLDPARLKLLRPEVAEQLNHKYARARSALLGVAPIQQE